MTVKIAHRVLVLPVALTLALSACATQSKNSSSGGNNTNAGASGGSATSCNTHGDSQGVTSSSIKLGAFTPLSGPVAPAGTGAVDGEKVYFDAVNKAGGINGHKIDFVTLDDKYDPAQAQADARLLETSQQVFALAGGVGTPNFVAVLPYIKQQHIPAIGPYAPSNQVGVMANPDVYMIWPNFKAEFAVSVKWMLQNEKPKKIAMLEMVGDVGTDALAGTKQALTGSGLQLSKIVTVEATTTDYSSAVLALKNTGADWVVSINQPTGTGQVIQAAKKIGYTPHWLTQSDMTDESWISAFGNDANGLVAATKVAPLSSTDPLVQDFVKTYTAATGKAPTLWNSVGYAQAEVTVEALKQAPAFTRECLEYSLQHMTDFKTGLLPPVTFSADSRQGTNAVGVARIENDKVVQVAPFQTVSSN